MSQVTFSPTLGVYPARKGEKKFAALGRSKRDRDQRAIPSPHRQPLPKRTLVEAEHDRGEGECAEGKAGEGIDGRARGARRRSVGGRSPRLEEGGFDPAEVIVDRNHDAGSGNDEEPAGAGLERGDEHEELPHETGERRDASERAQADGEHGGKGRGFLRQTR